MGVNSLHMSENQSVNFKDTVYKLKKQNLIQKQNNGVERRGKKTRKTDYLSGLTVRIRLEHTQTQ